MVFIGHLTRNGLTSVLPWVGNVARFVLFAPWGIYWATGTSQYDLITDHALLHNGTYSTKIVTGAKLASFWGTFGFCWNFLAWFQTVCCPPPLNLPFAMIDTIVAIAICLATHYQTGYTPHSKGACNPERNLNFRNMQRPPGTNESFFEAAARLNATVTSPKRMCEDFVEEWQYGMTLSCFCSIIAVLNVVAFVISVRIAKQSGQSVRKIFLDFAKSALGLLKALLRVCGIILIAFLYSLPQFIFRCLPLSFKAPVRMRRRNAAKAAIGLGQKIEMTMTDFTQRVISKRRQKRRYQGGDGVKSPLADFLGTYDMLILVAQELHYLDVINLSYVSKSVRESVLPAEDFDRRIAVFRTYTCHDMEKSRCWVCANQICLLCRQSPLIPLTTLLHHLDTCIPYCAMCYRLSINRRRPDRYERTKDPVCACAPVTGTPSLLQRLFRGRAHYKDPQTTLFRRAREVCRECNLLSADQLLAKRLPKTKRELQEGRGGRDGKVWTECGNYSCRKDLGTGPRWWVHISCRKECSSSAHRAWSDITSENKESIAVGDEAV